MRNLIFVFLISLSIKIFAQPTFTMATSICEQNSLTVASNNGTMAITGYTWSEASFVCVFSSPNSSVTSITFPFSGSYTIDLITTDGSNTYTYSNAITVNPLPNVLISASQSMPICPPPTNIGGLNMSASGANTYTWMPGSYTGSNVSINPQPSSFTTYSVTGTDANGCQASDTIDVPVYPVPSLFASSNSPVCPGDSICFNAGGTLNIYYWTGPCGFSSFNQNVCVYAVAGCGGVYTVGGSDGNGCINSTTISAVVANPTISVASTNSILCIGQSATLTASGATSYTWVPGGNGSSIVISPSVNTTYSINGINGVGCTNGTSFTQSVTSCVSIEDLQSLNESFSIYPNPVSEKLYFYINHLNVEVELEISDVSGKIIATEKIHLDKEKDVSYLQPGIYIVKIRFKESDQVIHRLFIKE